MRIYEELFILRPDTPEEAIEAYLEQIRQVILGGGGSIEKLDKWGVRKLAYKIQKRSEGFYVLVQLKADPAVVKEVERRMRVTDIVMKWITVRIDEKLKKLEKRTKQRERRAKRRPAPAHQPAASPAAPAAPTPGSPMPGAPAPAAPAAPAEAQQ